MDIPIVINEGSTVNGVFALTNKVRIEGKVFGKIESSSNIIIGKTGYMKGVVFTNDLVVYGHLEGTAVVMGTAKLFSGSSIFGSLYTRVINVEEGAFVKANIIVRDELEAHDIAKIQLEEENSIMMPSPLEIAGNNDIPHLNVHEDLSQPEQQALQDTNYQNNFGKAAPGPPGKSFLLDSIKQIPEIDDSLNN